MGDINRYPSKRAEGAWRSAACSPVRAALARRQQRFEDAGVALSAMRMARIMVERPAATRKANAMPLDDERGGIMITAHRAALLRRDAPPMLRLCQHFSPLIIALPLAPSRVVSTSSWPLFAIIIRDASIVVVAVPAARSGAHDYI